ncbi:hypothetical protein M0R45_004457 [Rubus argutus]|uniref:Pentatricopeptide repeat-containing protein n=1 Tax=Rubus argutus TaxID=59490 RepID=A0AAW1YJT0_RUBAR
MHLSFPMKYSNAPKICGSTVLFPSGCFTFSSLDIPKNQKAKYWIAEPDDQFLHVLKALNSLSHANSVMGYIIRKGFDKDLVISNALIDVHSRCGYISVVRKLLDGLVKKDAVSWNVMINGCGLNGNGEAALDLFFHMKLSGIRPNDITFSSVLSACGHSGLVKQGRMHGIQIYGRTWDSTPNGALCLHGGPSRKNG